MTLHQGVGPFTALNLTGGNPITNGVSILNIGQEVVGASNSGNFIISNLGPGKLLLTETPVIAISDAVNFSIITNPVTNISTSNGTYFTISVHPQTLGIFTNTLTITNDDLNNGVTNFLVGKNRAYGNSAEEPIGIFAKRLDQLAQIDVRIDDKLNRLSKGSEYPGDDTIKDLTGYLVLRMAIQGACWD